MPETSPVPFLHADLKRRLGTFTFDVHFELHAPWTVVFGPSGAGKSSLLRLIAGLDRADSHSIILSGTPLFDAPRNIFVPPGKRGVGLVMQQPALFPHMSVERNVGFGLRKLDSSARSSRVQEMLDLFEVEALAARKPADLSGGEKQRVALARALAPEPGLLMLDEPFSALDGALKDRILARLGEWLTARTIPAIYVSHDPTDAFQTGADVLVLRDGRVTAHGTAQEVLQGEKQRLLDHLS